MTPAGSVHKYRDDNVVRMWAPLSMSLLGFEIGTMLANYHM